jgi:hypothetical protein
MPFVNFNFRNVIILKGIIAWLDDNNFDFGYVTVSVSLFLLYAIWNTSNIVISSGVSFFFNLAPIWLPFICFSIFHFRWFDYVRKKFFLRQGRKQYRIKFPNDVLKSPEAMEYVLTQIWSVNNPDNFWEGYIDGKSSLPISLEMVSIGGDVRLYVNIPRRKGVETFVPSIYSQYPGIELVEEPVDYAAQIKVNDPDWDVWSTHLRKKEADNKWGPIKTYIEFGLSDMPKEEEKNDPMTILLDLLSSIGPNEHLYFQLVLRAIPKPRLVRGDLVIFEGANWTEIAEARVDEILHRDPKTKGPLNAGETDFEGSPRVSPGERQDVEAIERNKEKYAYRVGIRYFYAARKNHFNADILNACNRAFTAFDKIGRGSIGNRWRTDFNYMWFSDPFGDRLKTFKFIEHKHYKLRKFANHSQSDKPSIFTTEEIATIFHVPGKVAMTPGLERIGSTRAEAPSNLPTMPAESQT